MNLPYPAVGFKLFSLAVPGIDTNQGLSRPDFSLTNGGTRLAVMWLRTMLTVYRSGGAACFSISAFAFLTFIGARVTMCPCRLDRLSACRAPE